MYFGTNGTNTINKFCEIQSVVFGISEDEFVSKSNPIISGNLNLSGNYIKDFALNINNVVNSTDSLNGKDSSIVPIDSSNNSIVYTINTSVMTEGKILIIKDVGGQAGSNNITVSTQDNQTIDGQQSAVINEDYGHLKIFYHNGNWFII